ncbi:hypothetical protein LX36DRAFT_460039 [Colletotrichum falcatum]|nr:hypothetical protein LX36DRAFT_460039 [Colletotrichum falcatum]
MSSLIGKGDTIRITDELGKITVNWSQGGREQQEYYTPFHFQVTKGGSSSGIIFVQTNRHHALIQKAIRVEDYLSVQVDETFQYGDSSDQSKRFLVFHDKTNKPYQHRFVENPLTVIAAKAVGKELVGLVKPAFGDYLHHF